jgi:Raf kinase inhibitor-like YbhB/YbcL family protein
VCALATALALSIGSTDVSAQTPQKILVESPAFADGAAIPVEYSGLGKNVSPPLRWSNLPAGTREIALILDDPDADFGGRGPFVHWVVYKIPGSATGLPAGIPAGVRIELPGLEGAIQGVAGMGGGRRGGAAPPPPVYRGPGPPPGPAHRYHFKVYALSQPLDVGEGLDKPALLKAMEGKIIGEGLLVGTFQRP